MVFSITVELLIAAKRASLKSAIIVDEKRVDFVKQKSSDSHPFKQQAGKQSTVSEASPARSLAYRNIHSRSSVFSCGTPEPWLELEEHKRRVLDNRKIQE